MNNTTHTVIVKQQNRGLAFLIGLVSLFLLFRWFVTGNLLRAIEFGVQPASDDGVGSITGAILPLAVDIVIAIGTVLLAAGTGVWAVAWDIVSGVVEYFRNSRATGAATRSAIANATAAASATAGVASVVTAVEGASIASTQASQQPQAKPKTDAQKIQDALRILYGKMESIEKSVAELREKVFPPPPPEPTVDELKAEIARLRLIADKARGQAVAVQAVPQPAIQPAVQSIPLANGVNAS